MTLFQDKSPKIMQQLMDDFELTKEQAAGILGNIGHECGGFELLQEIDPLAGEGGYGWCQWTGPRRRLFLEWCKTNKLNPISDEANYGFLKHDLKSSYAYSVTHVKNANNYIASTIAFCRYYEYPGILDMSSRENYALIALNAFDQ